MWRRLPVSSVHLGQKGRSESGELGQESSWEATSSLWIKRWRLGKGNLRLLRSGSSTLNLGILHTPRLTIADVKSTGSQKPRDGQDPCSEHAGAGWRGRNSRGGGEGEGAEPRAGARAQRRLGGSGAQGPACEDLPGRWRPRRPSREQTRRRRRRPRRWQRRSWEVGVLLRGQASSGRTRVGSHTVSTEKVDAAAVGVVGARASGKSIVPCWPENPRAGPLLYPALCAQRLGLSDSLGCFCSSESFPGLCPLSPLPGDCLPCSELTVLAGLLSLCRWNPCTFFRALQLNSLLLSFFLPCLSIFPCLPSFLLPFLFFGKNTERFC